VETDHVYWHKLTPCQWKQTIKWLICNGDEKLMTCQSWVMSKLNLNNHDKITVLSLLMQSTNKNILIIDTLFPQQ